MEPWSRSHPFKRNLQPGWIMSLNPIPSRDRHPVLGSIMKSVLVLCRCPSGISCVLLRKVRACWMKQTLPPSSALAGSSPTPTEGPAGPVRRHQAAPPRRTRNEVIFLPLLLLGPKEEPYFPRPLTSRVFLWLWGLELSGTKRSREESLSSQKRKRKAGSPLQEMPDLSQTQKIYPQTSPSSSRVLELQLDSIQVELRLFSIDFIWKAFQFHVMLLNESLCLQSSDSTQIQEFQKSPVFPSSYRRAEVCVPRLSQDLVRSGIVRSSQDSWPLRSSAAHCRSPTFPRSPERSSQHVSLVREDGGESTPENRRSPVFAGNSPSGTCPSPRRDQVHNCNSGFTFSSQESLTSVARTQSCGPQSPVFPGSPGGRPATRQSPGSSDSCEGEAEHLLSRSPVFDGTRRLPQTRLEVQKHSMKEASQRTQKTL